MDFGSFLPLSKFLFQCFMASKVEKEIKMIEKKYMKLLLITLLVFLPFCEEADQNNQIGQGTRSNEWLIPKSEIRDGGPGKDGIPAISRPIFYGIEEIDFLLEDDLVIGVQIGNFFRAFPHRILDHHEIVNHTFDPISFSLTYCPLTGSGIVWDMSHVSGDRTLGVSGQLYNSNLIPYDRATDSNWSQMLNLCVNGDRSGEEAEQIHIVETTWETWKTLYPDSFVLSTDTGFSNDYNNYPYGKYKTNDNLLFTVSNTDSRLHKKERVLGLIVGDKTKVFPINEFQEGIQVINENFNGTDVVVIGSSALNLAVSFLRTLGDGSNFTFTAVDGELPVLLEDNEGTKYDVFGNALSGPRAGESLIPAESFISYWFAWAAFYPDAEIHNHPSSLFLQSSFFQPLGKTRNRIHSPHLETRFGFTRKEVEKRIRKEWPALLRTAKVFPVKRDGKNIGFQIHHLPIHSILNNFGIVQGDIIRTVNDADITGLKSLSDLLKSLPELDQVKIGIERENEALQLVINLN